MAKTILVADYVNIWIFLLNSFTAIKRRFLDVRISDDHYKHVMIVNNNSSCVIKWSFKLIDAARGIIYDCRMFIIQATGRMFKFKNLIYNVVLCFWVAKFLDFLQSLFFDYHAMTWIIYRYSLSQNTLTFWSISPPSFCKILDLTNQIIAASHFWYLL